MKHFLSKFYTVLGSFLVSLMAVSFCDAASGMSDSTNKTKLTIHVGIYAPFSSESAFIGRNMLGAMEIARDQLQSSEINYEFYTLDKIPSNAAAKTVQKFIEAHHINVLLTEGTESGALVAPLAKKNNIIHFCLTDDTIIADGKNNFQAKSPNHKPSAVLTQSMKPEFIAQYKQEYLSHPISQAGYAFDIFHLLHSSALLALKTHSDFSSQAIATHLLALESGTGVMGRFNLDKNGVSYKKQILTV
ncbi:branched-chain amino acid ABC transporter substrate-binding protein [Legionella anisa]|uniref:Branched-chain amino acid ABC transporter substrate-binding protein n=1 Tax=Legionella anisa TaxID=28082 RepID=A0AAX0WQ44_9GAMM|nr:branched-chain amino acid ABC transporter substrate-binding protein [Legionella anisa]AWN75299.1 branched-chain amino acid ABC transporter substrate-binding protein [Legionella anisa]KTC72662.1 branched-chain amino acid ABC transporter substrate-binding protein [Legionella anisa]MBN5935479.1 branched-chain amino acid ABC transporter substrate-binding protein [Legionella anisa]MCW8424529.1 branched-chain amino acid ABC transporter substrate-binding protein [Legionella anisa]MCW8446353.1 bran